jgi:hypothetical protein
LLIVLSVSKDLASCAPIWSQIYAHVDRDISGAAASMKLSANMMAGSGLHRGHTARPSRAGPQCALPKQNSSLSSVNCESSQVIWHPAAGAVVAAPQAQQEQQRQQRQQQQRQRQRPRLVMARSGSSRYPNQADSVFSPKDREDMNIGLAERVATRSVSDLDYLSVRLMGVSAGLLEIQCGGVASRTD